MSTQTPNDEFRNPNDKLGDAANGYVQALLSSVNEAKSEFGDLTNEGRTFFERSFSDIHEDVITGDLKLEDIVKYHVRATVAASLQTHCLTAFPWQAALARAQALDSDPTSKQLPLLGLVFSVKDCIHVKSYATTLGCSSRLTSIPSESAWIVSQIEALGGIMIAKTACPQAMVSNTTVSPLFGLVRSPYGDEYQVGGSSGGEAALVRLYGSMLGIGTDMGGSVRQPAALNELFGIKFKSNDFRFQQPEDFATGLPHTIVPPSTCGFLSRDLETMSNVIDALELYHGQAQPELRIGRSLFNASPEVQQAIKHVTGGNIVDLKLLEDNAQKWAEAWMDTACARGFEEGLGMIGSDPVLPTSLFNSSWPRHELEVALQRVDDLRLAFRKCADDQEVNLLVLPGFSYGVPVTNDVFFNTDEAELWLQTINLLDWVAMSVPVPVHPDLRQRWHESALSTENILDTSSDVGKKWSEFGVKASKTLPSGALPRVSIQLVAPPGNEFLLLDFAASLNKTL